VSGLPPYHALPSADEVPTPPPTDHCWPDPRLLTLLLPGDKLDHPSKADTHFSLSNSTPIKVGRDCVAPRPPLEISKYQTQLSRAKHRPLFLAANSTHAALRRLVPFLVTSFFYLLAVWASCAPAEPRLYL
jgi:hypothetical protein